VLRWFVRLTLIEDDQAVGVRTWLHAGFHVHTAVWVAKEDRAMAARLARYGARYPVALERLTYDQSEQTVTCRSDQSERTTAGTDTVNPLALPARAVVRIPDLAAGPRGTAAGRPTARAGCGVRRRSGRRSLRSTGARRRPDHLRVRPPDPRHHAGTFGVRGVPAVPAGPGSLARIAGRTACEAHRRSGGRAEPRSPVLARQGTAARARRTPIEFSIPDTTVTRDRDRV